MDGSENPDSSFSPVKISAAIIDTIPSDENLLLLIGSREAHGWKVINRCALLLDKAFVEYCQELATLLPVGLDVIGILVTQKQTESEENACLAIVSAMLSELSAVTSDPYVVINIKESNGTPIYQVAIMSSNGQKSEGCAQVESFDNFQFASFEGNLHHSSPVPNFKKNGPMEFPKWLEDDQLAFLLGSFGQDVMPIVVDKYVDSLKLSDVVLSGSVLCSDLIGLNGVPVAVAVRVSGQNSYEKKTPLAVLVHEHTVSSEAERLISLSFMMSIPFLINSAKLYSGLKLALQRQNTAVKLFLQLKEGTGSMDESTVNQFLSISSLIYWPNEFPHPITVVYPDNANENSLEMSSYRRRLHRIWLLPMDRPIFRRTNATAVKDYMTQGHIITIHKYVHSPSRQVALVKGNYAYHHYMQDGLNDSGWGCAYRAFQTIWSWFYLQGYSDRKFPQHSEIQQVLVKLGDKPAQFLGSKSWIGSMELSFCLSQMLKVDSRILTVKSGSDLMDLGRELTQHFLLHNTPVMIGGGMLAHTILGVSFDSNSGDCRFLVLDPHYTGDENRQEIISKGWCGWKTVDFWDSKSFYNLLLPLKPTTFL